MVTFFGISDHSVVPYDIGTSIKIIANENEYVIKRVKNEGYGGNWNYNYTILNKDLEPCDIKRNGWILSRFTSDSAFNPKTIGVNISDPAKMRIWDLKFSIAENSDFFRGWGHGFGVKALVCLLELLFKASNHGSWLEYLRTRSDIILDEKYRQDSHIDLQNISEIDILKDEFAKLRIENEGLKGSLEEIKNHIIYKLFMKRFMRF